MVILDTVTSYSGRKVFVTGHTGFKGAWLTQILVNLGAEVSGFSLPLDERNSHFVKLGLKDKIVHVEGDIRDSERLSSCVRKFQPEVVFHLAAQPIVTVSYNAPAETLTTNIVGGVNLLEAIRDLESLRALLFITSDKCYENREWVWGYRETDKLGGHDPYSASKAACEIVFASYWKSFLSVRGDVGAATTRAGNVIGGGDWSPNRIIPDCVRAIHNRESLFLRSPMATRPWQHVLEPLSGYLQLGLALLREPHTFSGAWNFGPSTTDCRTVGEVAQYMVDYFGEGTIEIGNEGAHHEAQLLQLNCDKAHQVLNWRPRWGFDESLEKTAEWYKKVLSGAEELSITCSHIEQYYPELSL